MRYLSALVLGLSLLVLSPAPADSSRGPKRATTTKKQQRGSAPDKVRRATNNRRPPSRTTRRHDYRNVLGRFSPTPRGKARGDGTILRRGLRGSGLANPSRVGKGRYDFVFQPASVGKSGSLSVSMTEWYGGAMSREPRTQQRQIFVQDARGKTVALDATMNIGAGNGGSFRRMTLEVTIPKGVQLTQSGLKAALAGGPVFANRYDFSFSEAKQQSAAVRAPAAAE